MASRWSYSNRRVQATNDAPDNQPEGGAAIDVLIVVGDQDSYHVGDDEIVASSIWLADILTEEGLVGVFLLQARRAEILAEGKRVDVIAALRRHEIGLHGRDIHPVIPEIVEDLDWPEGVAALLEAEGSELALLGRVFDVEPVCSSQHRNYGAPQLFGVARQLGMPYLFGTPCVPPTNSLSWFPGALNVPFNSPVPEFLGFFPSVFDDALGDDRQFEQLFARLQSHVARCLEVKLPLLVVFTCHPERLGYSGPLEQWRYGNGQNHAIARTPPDAEVRRSRAEVERALVNFRRLVRYLRDTPGLVPTTVRDVVRRVERPVARIPTVDLLALAEVAARDRQIEIGPTLSAADTIVGLAEALVDAESNGRLPESVARLDILGPLTAPPLVPEPAGVARPAASRARARAPRVWPIDRASAGVPGRRWSRHWFGHPLRGIRARGAGCTPGGDARCQLSGSARRLAPLSGDGGGTRSKSASERRRSAGSSRSSLGRRRASDALAIVDAQARAHQRELGGCRCAFQEVTTGCRMPRSTRRWLSTRRLGTGRSRSRFCQTT